jgi:hypothetical protein
MSRKILFLLLSSFLTQGLFAADTELYFTQPFQFSCPTETQIKSATPYLWGSLVAENSDGKNFMLMNASYFDMSKRWELGEISILSHQNGSVDRIFCDYYPADSKKSYGFGFGFFRAEFYPGANEPFFSLPHLGNNMALRACHVVSGGVTTHFNPNFLDKYTRRDITVKTPDISIECLMNPFPANL